MKGPREERLHLNRSPGVSCSCLDHHTVDSRDVIEMECTIVMGVVRISLRIMEVKRNCRAVVRCSYSSSWYGVITGALQT